MQLAGEIGSSKFSEEILLHSIDSVVESLTTNSDVLRAIALHAQATSDPDANLTNIRIRMNRLRSLLSPIVDDTTVVLSRTGLGFERVASKLFTKEIVRAGHWIHPRGGEVSFDRERLSNIVSETNRYLESVGRIPFPDGHKFDSAPTLGWVHAVWIDLAPEGDHRIMGLIEVHDEDIANKMGSEIRDVSMMLEREIKDSHGNTFHDVITHVAATPYPVIDLQATFEPLALSKRNSPVSVPILAPTAFHMARPFLPLANKLTESEQSCVSRKVPVLIKEGMKNDQAVAVAIEHCTSRKKSMSISTETLSALGFARSDKPGPEHIEERVLALVNERDGFADKIEEYSKAENERMEEELDSLVLATRESVVAIRNPEAFGADQEQRIRELWAKNDFDTARELCSLYGSKRLSVSSGAKVSVAPDKIVEAQDALDTAAARYSARGWGIDWDNNRESFTRRKGSSVIVEKMDKE